MLLSVCIIARNEAEFLPECLKSVVSVADEIILVDTGSEDATIELARRYGCRVFAVPWEEDFSAARNFALSQAQGEWILSLDADERLCNAELLHDTLLQASPDVGGFLLEHLSADAEGNRHRTWLLRLFRNHPHIRFRGRIHEQVAESIQQAGYRICPSPVRLVHVGYSNVELLRRKHERNRQLLLQALQEEPDSGYLWLQYARTALALGQAAEADYALERAAGCTPEESPLWAQIRLWQAHVALQQQQPTAATKHLQAVLRHYPDHPTALQLYAEALLQQRNWQRCLQAYERWERALAQPTAEHLLLGITEPSAAEIACRKAYCLYMLGRWEEAESLLLDALQQAPDHLGCRALLGHVYLSTGRLEHAEPLLADLERRNAPPTLLRSLQQHRERRLRARQRTRPLLSLSMIVRDEAQRLPACLDSVRDVVDEIVIVDTGSQDDTPEIARRYGALLFHVAWQEDFAAARNEALRHCQGEWILYLDADEQLAPESARLLRNLLEDTPEEVGALICTIESPHRTADGRVELHRGAYPRVFRNYGYPTIRFVGRAHEQISPSILALGKQIVASPLRILHFGYDQAPQVLQQKVWRNYRLLMQQVQQEPLDAYAWFQLGQTLARLQFYTEAESALRFALQLGTLSHAMSASAAIVLAQLCGRSRRIGEMLSWAEYALHYVPDHVYALYLKARALRFLGRPCEALEALRSARASQRVPELPTTAAVQIVVPEEVLEQEERELAELAAQECSSA